MRKILYLLRDIRRDQLNDMKAPQRSFQECDDKFAFLDHELSGVQRFGANDRFREVMTTGDFSYAIEEFFQREIFSTYKEQTFPFERLVKPDVLPSYLPVTRYLDQAGVDDLEFIGSKAQARPGSIDDLTKRQWEVWLWGKQYDFAHQALVNDDLHYFESKLGDIGRSARRTLEKFVSRLYTNATSIARLVALGAFYSATGRLTTARISTARMAFNQRVNARGERIQTPLRYIVHHTGLADTVAQIQNSMLVPELATNAANVIRGTFVPIEDPHMAGTAPNLPWFAFTDPMSGPAALVLARWSGMPGPMIVRKKSDTESITSLLGPGTPVNPIWGDFKSGNIVIKIFDIWGTYVDGTEGNLVDYQGAYYSSGTAP